MTEHMLEKPMLGAPPSLEDISIARLVQAPATGEGGEGDDGGDRGDERGDMRARVG